MRLDTANWRTQTRHLYDYFLSKLNQIKLKCFAKGVVIQICDCVRREKLACMREIDVF